RAEGLPGGSPCACLRDGLGAREEKLSAGPKVVKRRDEYPTASGARSTASGVHREWAWDDKHTFFKEEEHVPEDSEQRRGFQRASAAAGHVDGDVEVDGAALVGLPDQPGGG